MNITTSATSAPRKLHILDRLAIVVWSVVKYPHARRREAPLEVRKSFFTLDYRE